MSLIKEILNFVFDVKSAPRRQMGKDNIESLENKLKQHWIATSGNLIHSLFDARCCIQKAF